jgi:hypothetical protein
MNNKYGVLSRVVEVTVLDVSKDGIAAFIFRVRNPHSMTSQKT